MPNLWVALNFVSNGANIFKEESKEGSNLQTRKKNFKVHETKHLQKNFVLKYNNYCKNFVWTKHFFSFCYHLTRDGHLWERDNV